MWLTTTVVVIVSIVVCRGDVPYTKDTWLYPFCNRTGAYNETIVCYNMFGIISWWALHPLAFKYASNLDVVGTPGYITFLNPVSYNEMPNWIRIRVRNMNMFFLGYSSFYKLNNLEQIHLINTGIRFIVNNAFIDLPKFTELVMTGNRLTFFNYEIFYKCPSIKFLNFANNQISQTEDDVIDRFGTLGSIEYINFNNNRLNSSFKNHINNYIYYDGIRSLWYAHNKFTELRVGWFRRRPKLEVINFAYNEIEYIEENTFKDNPNLHTIVLSYNKLIDIPIQMLPAKFYPNLKNLAMDHNLIMGLDTSENGPLRRLTNLKKITLEGNPFYCSCLYEVHDQINQYTDIQEVCRDTKGPEHSQDNCIEEGEKFKTPCHLIPPHEHQSNRDQFLQDYNALPRSLDPMYCALEKFR
uniref:Toll-like receptor 6 n=1 Tax=Diabrotica virgifera virgifera TaxID=50390 RepID=A0A6P7FCL9_DIAVI